MINSRKYFCENAPEYHIACAGSLLGIALAKPSPFPVGKVNFMQIDPMTFAEFLLANGDENLLKYLESVDVIEPIPDAFFNPLCEKLKMYYVTGGMPESVRMWTEARDVNAMQEVMSDIIGAYERDFAKHPNLSEFPKISMIWKSIPSQLARKNKKFLYKVVKEGARAREYEVDFLIQRENDIFPVEVKAETNTKSRSLRKFKELFPEAVKLRVRFSLDNLKLDDDVLNIPLFMADQTDRLIGLALEQQKCS